VGALRNLLGTVETTFKVGKAKFDSAALTVARVITLPDKAGTMAMLSDLPGTTGSALNSAKASGAGPTLTLTEATVGSCNITGVQSTSTVLVIARCNPVKDATTTVRDATFRVRRGLLNTDTQVGVDSKVESTAVASTPFGGSAVMMFIDSGHGGGSLNYSIRGFSGVTGVVTTPTYEIMAIELKGVKGDASTPGFFADPGTPVATDKLDIYRSSTDTAYSPTLTELATAIAAIRNETDGTYTPVATNVANCASFGTQFGQYIRIGNTVFFNIQITVTPTTVSTLTSMLITVPVASTFASTTDASGTAISNVANTGATVVRCDTASGKLFASYVPSALGAQGLRITGSYQVI
jgi:hypothetical protein